LRLKTSDFETTSAKRRSLHANNISSSDDDEDNDQKLILDSQSNLEQTQALRSANPQLLRPEDYVRLRIDSFLIENSEPDSCMVKQVRCSNNNLVNRYNSVYAKAPDMSCFRQKPNSQTTTIVHSKGFCSYVTFVTSYIIFLFIVTLLLSRIGQI
jgi:hypothetical protein